MNGYSSVEEEFDEKASSYENNRLSSWYKSQGEIILNVLEPYQYGTILDIGCGTGWFLRQVLKAHPQLEGIGIDLSGRMIDVARQKAKEENLHNITFYKGEWESLHLTVNGINLESKPIRLIVCISAFHYFNDPFSAAKLIYRCLRNNGHFFLLDREREKSFFTSIWDVLHKTMVRDHVRFYRSTDLQSILEAAGFMDVQIMSKINKYFWRRKLFTSLVLLSARKLVKDFSAPSLSIEKKLQPFERGKHE
ncbi:MAG: class I SAM-dependent methyltransferase [Desulforhopalus sp.]